MKISKKYQTTKMYYGYKNTYENDYRLLIRKILQVRKTFYVQQKYASQAKVNFQIFKKFKVFSDKLKRI